MALALVSLLLFTAFVRAGSSTNASLSERAERVGTMVDARHEAREHEARSESDEVAYWHRLAAKRLRIIGKREQRIVALLKKLHPPKPHFSIPHYSAWLCIHSHEGSWTDAGDPYWGGLQMDRSFMQSYATAELLRRGWANVWTPLEQMWVAERAYRSGRGFNPWPNTARMCGLL